MKNETMYCFFLFLVCILLIQACDNVSYQEKKALKKSLADSMVAAAKQEEAAEKSKLVEDSLAKIPREGLIVVDDFYFKSENRSDFDYNDVMWTNPDESEFRFVYELKSKKLLVYKNSREFASYNNPKFLGYPFSKYYAIYSQDIKYFESDKTLGSLNLLPAEYAPRGFGKDRSSSFYHGIITNK